MDTGNIFSTPKHSSPSQVRVKLHLS